MYRGHALWYYIYKDFKMITLRLLTIQNKGKKMNTYIVYGKTNSEYASGMLNKPQDRLPIVKNLTDQFEMNIREFLFTHTESFTFFMVVDARSDEDIESAMNIARASGTWTNLFWSRAFDSSEHMKIYEQAKDGMASYVPTMQAAENS